MGKDVILPVFFFFFQKHKVNIMKSSLKYNTFILTLATGLVFSLTACGESKSSGDKSTTVTTQTTTTTRTITSVIVDNPQITTTPVIITKPNKETKKKINVCKKTTNSKSTIVSLPPKQQSGSSGKKGCGSLSKEEMLKKVNELRNQARYCYKEKKVFSATNPLEWSDTLEKSTRKFAYDMANHDYYNYFGKNAHLQPNTSKRKVNGKWKIEDAISFTCRTQEFDYLVPDKIGGLARENLAWSINSESPSVQTAVDTAYYGDGISNDGWLKSKHGHCEAIMNPVVEDFAMSCAYNAKTNKYYFVQLFGVQCKTAEECQEKGVQ